MCVCVFSMLPLLEWRDQIEKLITHAAYSQFLPPHTHIALFVSHEAAVSPLGPLVGMHDMDLLQTMLLSRRHR